MRSLLKRLPLAAIAVAMLLVGGLPASADTTPQTLPFGQNWTNTGKKKADHAFTDEQIATLLRLVDRL